MADTQQQKIDKFVRTMLYDNEPLPKSVAIAMLSVLVLFVVVGCLVIVWSFSGKTVVVTTNECVYTPVTRVFMHTPKHVSFFVAKAGNELKLVTVENAVVTWFADVPPGQPMRCVEYSRQNSNRPGRWKELIVHTHSVSDVNGGDWDNGKFGHGTTTVVE